MGKAIEPIAIQRGHEIVLRSVSTVELDKTTAVDADTAIEFTEPSSAKHHILTCFEGNSLWLEQPDTRIMTKFIGSKKKQIRTSGFNQLQFGS